MSGIAIPSGDLWSFNAALIEFVDGFLGLKGLWGKRDDFTDDLSAWNTSVAGGGSVDLDAPLGQVLLNAGTTAKAAILIDPDSYDPLTDEFRIDAATLGIGDNFITFNSIAEPTVMNNAAFSADRVITFHSNQALYVDNVGAFHSWNGAAWIAGTGGMLGYIASRAAFRNFDDSGTMRWQLILWDSNGNPNVLDAVAWSATRAPAGGKSLWFFTGSPRTNASVPSNYIRRYIRYSEEAGINYSQASPVATSPWFAIDQNTLDAITAILLQLILEGTSTIKFQWALNNGAFNGSFLTPAQLLAALVGQSITDKTNSMRLMAQFNSNGDDLPRILLPQTKAEASGVSGGSQAAIEDVRNGTIYNDGALTGTAFIPAKADTRSGTPVDDGVGTLAVAPPSDVRLNVATDDTVGNYVPAIEANHALGDSYGSLGTEFTGTKALTPFKLPVEVILEDSEIILFEGSE